MKKASQQDFINSLNIFSLQQGVSQEEIKIRYKELIKHNHPDLTQDIQEKAKREALTKIINNAYDILKQYQSEIFEKDNDSENIYFSFSDYNDIFEKFPNIKFTAIGLWLWIYVEEEENKGKTYPIKDNLVEAGFLWSKSQKAFYNPMSKSFKKIKGFRPKSFQEKVLRYGKTEIFKEKENFKKIA